MIASTILASALVLGAYSIHIEDYDGSIWFKDVYLKNTHNASITNIQIECNGKMARTSERTKTIKTVIPTRISPKGELTAKKVFIGYLPRKTQSVSCKIFGYYHEVKKNWNYRNSK